MKRDLLCRSTDEEADEDEELSSLSQFESDEESEDHFRGRMSPFFGEDVHTPRPAAL